MEIHCLFRRNHQSWICWDESKPLIYLVALLHMHFSILFFLVLHLAPFEHLKVLEDLILLLLNFYIRIFTNINSYSHFIQIKMRRLTILLALDMVVNRFLREKLLSLGRYRQFVLPEGTCALFKYAGRFTSDLVLLSCLGTSHSAVSSWLTYIISCHQHFFHLL